MTSTTDIEARLAQATEEANRRLTERDLEIIRAFAVGASLRRIADATGLSHAGVKKLVERRQYDFVIEDEDGNVLSVAEAKIHGSTSAASSAELLRRWKVIYTVNYDAEGAAADSK